MKVIVNTAATLALLFHLPQFAFAIGDQHGLFRSQSTQGEQWMGTAEIVEEEFRITVHPNYLDVELDWVFRVGGQKPQKHSDALEIVGNLNFVNNSVVVGMLTWWKGDILKGKLKTTDMARADYEDVVQRDADAPPPPRDPVLLEYSWGEDNYDISIFPATFGETRKVRIHYLVPAYSVGGAIKAPYPHAFTQDAKVSVKTGPGVESYKVETQQTYHLFANKEFEALSSSQFAFAPYSNTREVERISYIMPVLADESEGSRFYVGAVSGPHLSGYATDVVVPDAPRVIAASDLQEDFVILWRWNHVKLLNAYARQLVSHSKLLQEFLGKLEGANKRAALIVSKDGEEDLVFSLSKIGDAGYQKMMAYLDSLADRTVVDPPTVTTSPKYDLKVEAQKAQSEFEAAIQKAIALFDNDRHIRHLLILTSGPRIMQPDYTTHRFDLDSTVHITTFTGYAEKLGLGMPIPEAGSDLYWPGVYPVSVLTEQTLDLTILAVVQSGSQSCTLQVLTPPEATNRYGASRSEIQKHVFSSAPLANKVSWTITQGGDMLSSYDETPQVIEVSDPLALAKIIGASEYMTPMAPQLPRSMAATLGFIDTSYSLVALEEDKLPSEQAAQYASKGVPSLATGDIYAASGDLESLSKEAWIKENPTQPLWSYSGGNYAWGWVGQERFMLMHDKVVVDMAPPPMPVNKGEGGPFMAMPVADGLTPAVDQSYTDYSDALSIGKLPESRYAQVAWSAEIRSGRLVVDLSRFSTADRQDMRIALVDIRGREVYEINMRDLAGAAMLDLPLEGLANHAGLYFVRIRLGQNVLSKKLMVE